MRFASAVSGVVLLCGIGLAQAPAPSTPATGSSGPAAEVQRAYAGLKANILKAAERMPAADYAFKPTPDIRSFARVVAHVTEAQTRVCRAANGPTRDPMTMKPPATESPADRAAILAALQASFTECDQAYAGLNSGNMLDVVDVGPMGKRSRIGLLWGNVSHDNEQYATLSLYLRLKGLVPPSSEK